MMLARRSALLVSVAVLLVACGTGDGDTVAPETDAAPTAPTTVRAQPGPGYVTVTWEDASDDETGFVIYRDDGAEAAVLRSHENVRVGEVEANTERFVDLGAIVGADSTYRVTAVNEHGASEGASATEVVRVEAGVDLLVGTNDRRYDDGTRTVFIVYLILPESVLNDADVDIEIRIDGPAGWNGGEPHVYTEPAGGFAPSETFWRLMSRLSCLVLMPSPCAPEGAGYRGSGVRWGLP